MKVLVCGGRDYTDYEYLSSYLTYLDAQKPITEIIHGAARGADGLAGRWAQHNRVPQKIFHAEWDKYGKSAGYKRNVQMADYGPDIVIAFPGGKGTSMMTAIAEKRNIPVTFIVKEE